MRVDLGGETVGPTIGVVDSVRPSGRVNVNVAGVVMEDVPCLGGYWPRKAADKVRVDWLEGQPHVLGLVHGPDREMPVPPPPPPVIKVTSANVMPAGPGWLAPDKVWIRDDGDGNWSLHYQMVVAPPPPVVTPTMNPVNSSSWGAWRHGKSDSWHGAPAQGVSQWSSNPATWSGGWFFPNLASAIAATGGTPARMTLTLRRANSGGNGAAVIARLYRAANSANSSTPIAGSDEWVPGKIGRGSSATWTMDTAWRTAFTTGAAKSVICRSSAYSEYMIYQSSATISVYFK